MSAESLEFSDLPLIEVALKRVPRAHLPLSLPFVLELQKSLPARFDRILDLDVLEAPPGLVQAATYNASSTCGCRLVDSSLGISVSLQPDMLVVRWTHAEGKGYPRFLFLRDAANDVTTAIEKIGLQPFQPVLVNMAYANKVDVRLEEGRPQPNPWPLSVKWTPVGVKEEGQAFETQSVFRGADEIDRRVLVQYRQETPDAKPWYLLLTIAGKPISEGESIDKAEERVHQALIDWFPQLLSGEAKEVYGLQQ